MAKLLSSVVWANPNNKSITLSDVERINIRKSADIKNNFCEITLKNSQGYIKDYISPSGKILFSPDQQIDVYVRYDDDGNGLSTVNDLLFSGRTIEFDCSTDENNTPLKLKCSDSSFIAMNKLWVGDESKPIPNLILDVVEFINYSVSDDSAKITANLTTGGGYVASSTSAGSSFPTHRLTKVYKPCYEVIQELSQPDITGDGTVPYRFHIDKNNELHWFFPNDTAVHVLAYGATTPQSARYIHPVSKAAETVNDTNVHYILNYKLTNSVYDIVNFIIYKAGEDLNNVQILDFEYDATSGAPVLKDSFRNWEDISRELKKAEENAGNLILSSGDNYTIVVSSGTTSWGVVYSSESDYNNKFKTEVIRRGDARAHTEFKQTGSPRYKGKFELRGTSLFEANDGLIFSSEAHGIEPVFFRVVDVQHNIDKNGWFTTISIEEEIEDDST